MDNTTKNVFRETIFSVISNKSALPFGDECSVDFFQSVASKPAEFQSGSNKKVNYSIEGLSYLDQYLGKELFNPNQNILVVRRGQPYPVQELTATEDKSSNVDEIDVNSPQRKISKLNTDSNQNNINERKSEDIYDTCGSPLKLQTYADLSTCDSPSYASPAFVKRSSTHYYIPVGLSSLTSRQLISLFIVNYTELMSASVAAFSRLPSLWILCDKNDIKSSVLMGAQPVLSNSGGDKQWGVKLTTVTQVETEDILATSKINKIFNQKIHENKCFARYDLVKPTASSIDDFTAYQGSLSLEFQWKNGTQLLQKPEYHSEAIIKASVHSGDIRSPAIGLFEELTILKSLMTAITTSEINWAASKDQAPLLDMVKELIENTKLGDTGSFKKLHSEDMEKNPSDQFKLKERLDYDFTDHLWKILITCSSYSDLTTSLNYIFKALGKGEFQPAVHKKNKTMMAQYIRDSYTGRLIIPHLGGMFPLKLVVEMGIEKLRCDYLHAFVSQDLTTPSHLDYFLQVDVDLEEKICRMEKMQYSLEMVVMIQLFFRLPYSILGTCARKMLKHFQSNEINDSEIFEFPVQTKTVLPVVKESQPSLWSLTVEKKVGNLSEQKVWTLTTNQPFIHLTKDLDEREEKKDDEKSHFYLTYRDDHISITNNTVDSSE
ncbi:hypothetical protein LOTGIDRAFT_230528 [Lottia gigantea]|uniref:Protein zwilch n=1 Tax=Lottia gigantea TaxID=225164 RepID=V4B3M5_LOTGI|nr:hypothetical protein LOTGIDRAFT_230528 [Lottia gigantea]ESP01976.1 hypothetical protein LOTGIDRAFT_230528 [Lottia gigantea]